MSALRACESVRSIANPREGKKKYFFSQRNSIETVLVSVPLDVLKQYFGIFVKMGLKFVHNFLIAAAGSRSSEAEGDLYLSEVGVLQTDWEEDQRSFG